LNYLKAFGFFFVIFSVGVPKLIVEGTGTVSVPRDEDFTTFTFFIFLGRLEDELEPALADFGASELELSALLIFDVCCLGVTLAFDDLDEPSALLIFEVTSPAFAAFFIFFIVFAVEVPPALAILVEPITPELPLADFSMFAPECI
jgi:hypothetical protein